MEESPRIDSSPLERLTRKYTWKGYSLYDVNLQSLRPAQCFRAATADGENSIFVISDSEERELVAKGRLTKERQLLAMASRALERTEEERGGKRRGHAGMSKYIIILSER